MNFSYYQRYVNWQIGFCVTSNQKYPHSETMKLITLSKRIITSKIVVFHFRQRGETHKRFGKFTLLARWKRGVKIVSVSEFEWRNSHSVRHHQAYGHISGHLEQPVTELPHGCELLTHVCTSLRSLTHHIFMQNLLPAICFRLQCFASTPGVTSPLFICLLLLPSKWDLIHGWPINILLNNL